MVAADTEDHGINSEYADALARLNRVKLQALGLGASKEQHLVEWIDAVKQMDVDVVREMRDRYELDPFEVPPGYKPKHRSEAWHSAEMAHLKLNEDLGTYNSTRIEGGNCAGCAMMEAVRTDNTALIGVLLEKDGVPLEKGLYGAEMLQVFRDAMDEGKLHALAFLLKERSTPKTGAYKNVLLYATRHHLFASQFLLLQEAHKPCFFRDHWDDRALIGETLQQAKDFETDKQKRLISHDAARQPQGRNPSHDDGLTR